jgi:hypothetical protein
MLNQPFHRIVQELELGTPSTAELRAWSQLAHQHWEEYEALLAAVDQLVKVRDLSTQSAVKQLISVTGSATAYARAPAANGC